MSKRMWLRMVRILEAAGWLSRSAKTGGVKNPGALYWLRDLPTGAYPLSPNGHGPGELRERSSPPGDSDPIRRELWPPDPAGVQAFDPRIQTPHPRTTLANVPYITSERSQLGGDIGDSEIAAAGLNVPELPLKVALRRMPERSLGERSCPTGDSLAPPGEPLGEQSIPPPAEQGGDPTPKPPPQGGGEPQGGGIPVHVYNGQDFEIRRGGAPPEIKREVTELFKRRGVRGWRELERNSEKGGDVE